MSVPGLLRRVADFLRTQLSDQDSLVVVGVSGGVDSMVLLDVLVRLDVPVLAAHVNYGLRGEASDADEALVRSRCAALGASLETARFDTKVLAAARRVSVQEAARDLRYAFFGEVAVAAGAPAVAVAHHADDQAETVLLNLFRGTGITGLAGMPSCRPIAPGLPVLLVRPLLQERRRELEAYARAHQVPWREDATNASDDYRRTILRRRVLPLIAESFDEDVAARIARTAGFVGAYLDEVLEPQLRARFDACARPLLSGGMLAQDALNQLPPAWRTRLILQALARWIPGAPRDAATAARVEALLGAQVGRKAPVAGGVVWREREGLWFLAGSPEESLGPAEPVAVPLEEGNHAVPGGLLSIRRTSPPFEIARDDPYVATMDADSVAAPIVFRLWQPGDVIQPLGMRGHKNVSDLLTEAKVPSNERSTVRIVEAAGDVIWIPGVRLSETVKVRADTKDGWTLTFTPGAWPHDAARLPGRPS